MQSPIYSPGLTSAEAARLLAQYGPNALSEAKKHPLLDFLKRLWGPIPWMLEAVVILQVVLKKYDEALIIAALILFNAVFSACQEKHSSDTLENDRPCPPSNSFRAM